MVEPDRRGTKETDDVEKSEGSGHKGGREQEAKPEVEAGRKDSKSMESSEEDGPPPAKKPRKF